MGNFFWKIYNVNIRRYDSAAPAGEILREGGRKITKHVTEFPVYNKTDVRCQKYDSGHVADNWLRVAPINGLT